MSKQDVKLAYDNSADLMSWSKARYQGLPPQSQIKAARSAAYVAKLGGVIPAMPKGW